MRLDTKVVKEYFTPPTPPSKESAFPQSPTLAVPKQIRRSLPAFLVLAFLFFFFSGSVGTPSPAKGIFHHRQKYLVFPHKIWQTWKVDPLGFEERDSNVAKTWIQKNPEYRYEVLTDQNDMAYVEWHFGPEGFDRPDIVYLYRQLTARIIKADLLRYMVMYVEGGLYTDIDVEALRPINKFIPDRWDEKDIDMIIGVEIDQPEFANHTVLGQKCMSFVQWTFVCKPRLPVMMTLIEYIMTWLKSVAREQKVPISEIKLDFDQVITGTGPTAFTRAIMNEMERREGKKITWDMFHGLTESKLVGGVLVLTVEAFAAGQGHSDSGTHEGKHSLVRHHYHASKWPITHPRLKHPVYKEVEQCNWEWDCVEKWDRDVAEFEFLPEEEKQRLIAETEEKDRIRDEEDRAREEEERLQREAEEAEERWQEERRVAERVYMEEQRMAAEAEAAQRGEHYDDQRQQPSEPEQPRVLEHMPEQRPAEGHSEQRPTEHSSDSKPPEHAPNEDNAHHSPPPHQEHMEDHSRDSSGPPAKDAEDESLGTAYPPAPEWA